MKKIIIVIAPLLLFSKTFCSIKEVRKKTDAFQIAVEKVHYFSKARNIHYNSTGKKTFIDFLYEASIENAIEKGKAYTEIVYQCLCEIDKKDLFLFYRAESLVKQLNEIKRGTINNA